MLKFIKGVMRQVWEVILDLFRNLETVTVLVLASYGASVLIADVPFMTYIPPVVEAWIAVPMVVPVLGVLLVSALVSSIKWRAHVAD